MSETDLTPAPEPFQRTLPREIEEVTLSSPCTRNVPYAATPTVCRSTEGYLDTRTGKYFCARCGHPAQP